MPNKSDPPPTPQSSLLTTYRYGDRPPVGTETYVAIDLAFRGLKNYGQAMANPTNEKAARFIDVDNRVKTVDDPLQVSIGVRLRETRTLWPGLFSLHEAEFG